MSISQKTEYQFFSLLGNYYSLKNPNQLLKSVDDIALSKTGFTKGAGQCILIQNTDAIIVLLDAQDRFANALELIGKISDLDFNN